MSEIIKESFKDTSYKLAKALHFNKVSLEYFEMLRLDSKGETKICLTNVFSVWIGCTIISTIG